MKPRFNTSREIYNRILWDEQFNERAFFMGYRDRMSPSGMREKPLIEWGTSEIPWSRVFYIRCGEELVWDRDQRIDLFEEGKLPSEAFSQAKEQHREQRSDVYDRSIYHRVGAEWEIFTATIPNIALEELKVLTINVLTDRYERGQLYSDERWAWMLHALQRLDVDILLLQEVSPTFYKKLLRKRWVYSYYLSESPACSTLKPFGNVIISKYPFHLREWKYSESKRFPIASFQFNEQSVQLANVHLSSNQNPNAKAVRKEQLMQLFAMLESQEGTYLVGGDYNMRDSEKPTSYGKLEVEDIWQMLHPNDAGLTYDPEKNPLAKLFSLSGKPGRLDRVLINSKTNSWTPVHCDLVFNQPIGNFGSKLYPSDHYGLCATLAYKGGEGTARLKSEAFEQLPTYQSAIVWIPPKSLWPAIQLLRKKHDAKFERWMPHVTLVYGFIPEEFFADVLDGLSTQLQKIEAFSIELTGYGTFDHRKSTTAWLNPNGAKEEWHTLQRLIEALFVNCKEQGSRNGAFTPHLSIGQFASSTEAKRVLPTWKTLKATVGKVALISRGKDTPFEVRYTVALGSGKLVAEQVSEDAMLQQLLRQEMPMPSVIEQEQMTLVKELVADACGTVLGCSVTLYPIGSVALGTNVSGGDLDLVCGIPPELDLEDTLEAITAELSALATETHLVLDAQMPALRFFLEGVAVDLLLVRNPYFPKPLPEVMERSYREFDQVSWMALGGVLEARNLKELMSREFPFHLFQDLVRLVKLWAKRRGIAGNAWGYLGSYSWTVLAAWTCRNCQNQEPSLMGCLKVFFDQLYKHDWAKPIALVPREKTFRVSAVRDRMPIMTTIHPQFNSARNITRSTAIIIQQELERANRLMKANQLDLEKMFEPLEAPNGIRISCLGDKDALRKAAGWLEGHIITLVIALEKNLPLVRPWPKLISVEGGFVVHLGIESNAEVVKEILEGFVEKMSNENETMIKLEVFFDHLGQ